MLLKLGLLDGRLSFEGWGQCLRQLVVLLFFGRFESGRLFAQLELVWLVGPLVDQDLLDFQVVVHFLEEPVEAVTCCHQVHLLLFFFIFARLMKQGGQTLDTRLLVRVCRWSDLRVLFLAERCQPLRPSSLLQVLLLPLFFQLLLA